MRRLKRISPIVVGIVVVAIVVLWLTRPMWHGIALFFWTAPLVWRLPRVLLGIGALLLPRSQRSWTTLDDLRSGVRPPRWLLVFPLPALFVFIFGAALSGPLGPRANADNPTHESIGGLPPGGKVRLVPREVAEQNASSAFNSPT